MFTINITSNAYYSDVSLTCTTSHAGASTFAQRVFNSQVRSSNPKKIIDKSKLYKLAWDKVRSPETSSFGVQFGIAEKSFARSNDERCDVVALKKRDGTFTRDSLSAARRKLKQILIANVSANIKFLTLTENEEHKSQSFDDALKALRAFIRRLSRFVESKRNAMGARFSDVQYIAIPELGSKNNRLHWHLILWSPYIQKDVLAKLWGRGFIDVKSLKISKNKIDVAKQVSSYVSKYVTSEVKRIEGRKMIYYSSKNIKGVRKYAVLNEKQRDVIFDYIKKLEDMDRISAPFWRFAMFRHGEVDPLLCERYRARRILPRTHDVQPADIIEIKFVLNARQTKSFLSLLEHLYVQLEERGIMTKTATEKDCDARRKLQADAFLKVQEDKKAVFPYTQRLAAAYPFVPAGYIYGVLNLFASTNPDEPIFSNFDALNYFASRFDVLHDKPPAMLKPQLSMFLPKKPFIPLAQQYKFMRKFRYCDVNIAT